MATRKGTINLSIVTNRAFGIHPKVVHGASCCSSFVRWHGVGCISDKISNSLLCFIEHCSYSFSAPCCEGGHLIVLLHCEADQFIVLLHCEGDHFIVLLQYYFHLLDQCLQFVDVNRTLIRPVSLANLNA